MPRDPGVNRVLLIGSGPIVIGQAAEFDYAGTQACRSLREEGVEVVLVNSNPATIMTDPEIADRIYFQPLTVPYLERIIARERPDGLLPSLGGQTGLNLAVELARAGILDRYGVRLLGTPLETIERAEDRQLFKEAMQVIGEPVLESRTVASVAEGLAFAEEVGYPVILRPAFTLGGTGGGMAEDEAAAREILARGLKRSPIGQVLVERSVAGWKEIEFEVMRDRADNCITVCSMENLDPIGIHTGDSAVIAPSQTLSDREFQMLRSASLRIIRALGVEGGCNIQFALSPTSLEYYVIEVNPRVSRSSALASKATGYPIARVAAKVAVGLTLPEITNRVTGKTTACFEPALDYVVMKLPRWPFDTFDSADRSLGTQMKATGEVMAIGRSYEEALMKAVRSLDQGSGGLLVPGLERLAEATLARRLARPDDQRLFLLAEALRRGWSVERVSELSRVDPFFLDGMARIVRAYEEAARLAPSARGEAGAPPLTAEVLRSLKAMGLPDAELARLWAVPEEQVREKRQALGVQPVYKMVDTCAAEFDATTPYYYSTYDAEDESRPGDRPAVVVLGSGPIRIGQGIEFDYACVHSAWALQAEGYRAVMVNSNPETVSTDFDTSDALYFEPLTVEDVLRVVETEHPLGVVAQFGGQTAINLVAPLHRAGVPILGTSPEAIDICEDRERFAALCRRLQIPQPEGVTATSVQEAMGYGLKLGFPLLVRPSYVLGGRAMEIVTNEQELFEYLQSAVEVSRQHPVLVDRYLPGREVEVDLICDGARVLIPGIMEHVERAGIHSGDSSAIFPPRSLSAEQQQEVAALARRLALAVGVRGIFNIQFVLYQGRFYCLEANPRASRTVPFLSKVTGVPLVRLATQVMLGRSLEELGYRDGLMPAPRAAGGTHGYTAVKTPVFSFEKMQAVETSLGPEMKSTGEVMGLDRDPERALAKALLAGGMGLPDPLPGGGRGQALLSVADREKGELPPLARRLADAGFDLLATPGTARVLREAGLEVEEVPRTGEGSPDPLERIRSGQVRLVVNTPTQARQPLRWGFRLRRVAVEFGVPCFTSLDTLAAALGAAGNGGPVEVEPLEYYLPAGGHAPALPPAPAGRAPAVREQRSLLRNGTEERRRLEMAVNGKGKQGVKKVVLAYSGGLDTSVIIPWLKENYGCQVVAMVADVGQEEDLNEVRAKALASGADRVYVEDLKEAFVRDVILPTVQAGAVYEDGYLLGTSMARPVIATRQVQIAEREGADALAHGATGKGNDQVRFELTYKALRPDLRVIAPWREWEIRSRTDAIRYAKAHGVPVTATAEKPYSIDENLWHTSYEGGVLEDPWNGPDPSMFRRTADPQAAPDTPEEVTIGFEAGVPVTLNGRPVELLPFLQELNRLAGRHGVGRVDLVENRLVGMKSRGVYETPGGTVWMAAHRALETLVLDRATAHMKAILAQRYAELVYDGLWETPLRRALDAFVASTQERVTGEVRLRLFKGSLQVTGRRSPHALYDTAFATFEEDSVYHQGDAAGFIRLFGLPLEIAARRRAASGACQSTAV